MTKCKNKNDQYFFEHFYDNFAVNKLFSSNNLNKEYLIEIFNELPETDWTARYYFVQDASLTEETEAYIWTQANIKRDFTFMSLSAEKLNVIVAKYFRKRCFM